MKKFIIIIIAIFLLHAIQAQNGYVAHFDKPFYVSGDVVSYDLKLPKSFKDTEVAFNNYVADSRGNILQQFFTNNLKKSSFDAYFKIPYNWDSDMYQLVISAQNKTTGVEITIAKVDIPIYNDISSEPMEFADLETPAIEVSDVISINTEKIAYGPREKVNITLSSSEFTDASVVVSDKKLFRAILGLKEVSVISQVTPEMLSDKPYLTGQVTDSNGKPLKINVLGVFDSKSNNMLYSKSNTDGLFQLSIDSYVGNKELHLHPYLFGEAKELSLKMKENTGTKASSDLTIDSTVIKYMQISRDRKKIYQQFGKVENNLSINTPKISKKNLKANRTFIISDYQSFENIAAFFNEILTSELSFIVKEDGKLAARMYNPKNKKNAYRDESSFFEKSPIFIIDDKITQDADRIGSLPLDNITSIDLYFKVDDIKENFGTFGGSAYVRIMTTYPNFLLDDEEEEDIVSWHGYLPNMESISISNEAIDADEPIYKSVIFYDAEISPQGELEFYSSDDITDYEILIISQSESGQLISGATSFKVRY